MTTSIHPSLGQHAYTASIDSSAPAAAGTFPRMSARATLIARVLGATVLLGLLAVTEPRFLVVLAFAVPFWIGAELEARGAQLAQSLPGTKVGYAGLALVRNPSDTRPSNHPAPKAA